ncbi:AAA family ATPase [Nonomuraea sp. NPDC052116]|uniref:AAA family ATPase n=1 Tax=Nonomuraea sp. NPDC052116 TaxID=3155665 RepID=UPI00342A582B
MATSSPPDAGGEGRSSASGGNLRLQILGPLRLWRDGVELATGPRQQAYLLALLLARAGKPISTSELIDLIWGDDVPASAVNILQKYVGSLRRLLEPALPARTNGTYLQRRANGYLFAGGAGMLDLLAFREFVEAARAGLAERRPDAALDSYVRALGRWHGPAGDGLFHGSTAMSIFAALDGEFFDACAAAAELAVSRGRPARVLQPLYLAAGMAPLHETVQAGLVAVLGAAGHQSEALKVFRTVRARLAEELGIGPGPALLEAYQRVLRQPLTSVGGYDAHARTASITLPATAPKDQPTLAGRAEETHTGRRPASTLGEPPTGGLVGRVEELAVLRQAVESARAGGTALVLVEGEPGVGKTRLLEEISAEADRRGALVVWGRCLEGDGAPSMWLWVQAVGALLEELPAAAREEWRSGELGRLVEPRGGVPPDSGARFRLFEQAIALVGQVSALRPVVLVVDDLQWADVASLQLFGHLAARLPGGTAVIGALRDRAPMPGSELARMLAAASRLPRHRRVRLGPLGPAEVAELVRHETGRTPGAGVARGIHARTAGNPFFVRELSRFLADSGELTEDAAARAGMPFTVRDVVKDRMAGLDDAAREVLRIAALIGRDVDLALLARAAGFDVQTCLDRLEPLEDLGLLEPFPGDPFSFRFPHDLVRESVVRTMPQRHAPRLHLRVADALEPTAQDDVHVAERLSHHLWAAGPLVEPGRTAGARGGNVAGRRDARPLIGLSGGVMSGQPRPPASRKGRRQ